MEVVTCDGTKGDNFLPDFRILLVDDDEISLRVIEKVLTSCKYEVVAVNRATNALNILHESKGRFDLILADVHMPIMDGFELLAIVQKDFQIPVILVSADSDMDLMARGLKFGACAFCAKPVTKSYAQNLWQFVCMQRIHQQRLVEEEIGSSRQSSLEKKDVESSSANLRNMKQQGIRLKEKGKKYEEVEEDDNEQVEDYAESDEERITPKKSRMVWTPNLHQKFVCAIKKIGIKKAVPKKILECMKVKGVDRTKIASHLQKYRNYLKGSKESSQYGSKIWDRYPTSYTPGSQFSDEGGSSDFYVSQAKYGHPYRTILNQRNIQRQLMSTGLNTASVPTSESSSFKNLVYQQLQDPTNFPFVENSGFMNISYLPDLTNVPSIEEPVINYPSYDASSYKSNYVGLQLCDREGMVGLRQAGLGAGVNSYTLTSNNMNGTLPRKMSGERFETLINVSNNNQVTPVAPTIDLYVNPNFFQTAAPVPVAEPQQQERQDLEGMDLDCWSDLMMNNSTNDLSNHVPNEEYTQQEHDLEGLIMDLQFNVGDFHFDDNYQPQI